jgi:hypothetical protein
MDDCGEHVVGYASMALSSQQQKWSTVERECYAVVWAINHFDNYLDAQQFELIVDNHALCYLFSLKTPNSKLTSWAIQVQDRNMSIKFKPGKQHCDVDCLSRHGFVGLCEPVVAFASQERLVREQERELSLYHTLCWKK